MPVQTEELNGLWALIGGIFLLALLLAWLGWRLPPFLRKLRNVNMELHRCDPRERKVWQAQRRHLWCALFNPFMHI